MADWTGVGFNIHDDSALWEVCCRNKAKNYYPSYYFSPLQLSQLSQLSNRKQWKQNLGLNYGYIKEAPKNFALRIHQVLTIMVRLMKALMFITSIDSMRRWSCGLQSGCGWLEISSPQSRHQITISAFPLGRVQITLSSPL